MALDCGDSAPLALAVLLSGQVRTFVEPRVHLRIRENLLGALCPTRRECTVSLVLCVELGHCASNFGDQLGSRAPSLARLRAAVSALGVGAVSESAWPEVRCDTNDEQLLCGAEERQWCSGPRRECRSAEEPIHPDLARWNSSKWRSRSHLSSDPPPPSQRPPKFVQGLVRWLRCMPRLLEAERTRGSAFDWVAIIRPDVAFFDAVPSLHEFARHGRGVHLAANQYSPVSDLWALMPRQHAQSYLSAITQLCCLDCWWRSQPFPWDARALHRDLSISATAAEALLAAQLHVHATPVFPGYIPFAIVRQQDSRQRFGRLKAECSRWRVCNTSTSAVGDLRSSAGPEYWPACDPQRVRRCERWAEATGSVSAHVGAEPGGDSTLLSRWWRRVNKAVGC